MSIPEEVIKHLWFTAGSGVLWDAQGTYTPVEYERLPLLPEVHTPFDWLSGIPKRNYDCTLGSDENKIANVATVSAAVQRLGYNIPEAFRIFITRPDIQAQIPSCTACYLELSEDVVPLPGFPGSYAVRFMNDSQCCVLWYLLFQPDRPIKVLASPYFIEREIFDAMEYQSELDEPLAYGDVLSASCICADSFDEFMFRFHIENAIWFGTHAGFRLAPYEQAYLDSTKTKS